MCNAWNHPPGCTCGWGGIGHKGVSPGGWHNGGGYHSSPNYYTYQGNRLRWRHYDDDFCRPTRCPICGASVFFVRHNGGSVWFDALGKPWPKHACFDVSSTPNRFYYHSTIYGWNSTRGVQVRLTRYAREHHAPLLGIVVEGNLATEDQKRSICIRAANGKTYWLQIPEKHTPGRLVGEAVLISAKKRVLVFISLDLVIPFWQKPQVPKEGFLVGARYRHGTFGVGTLMKVEPMEKDWRLTLYFQDVGVKSLVASLAKLVRVAPDTREQNGSGVQGENK